MVAAYIRQARVDIAPPGIGIDRLRLTFAIHTASQGDPSPSSVIITNLAETTVERLTGDATVRLSAGYRGHPLDNLYLGQITRIEHEFDGRDRRTILTLGNASLGPGTAAIVSAGYQGAVTLRSVVTDIAGEIGLPVGPLDAVPHLVVEDYAHMGKAYDALTALLRPRGVEWYESNGELLFRRRGIADAQVGFVLSEATGMVGSPERTENGVRARMRLTAQVRLNQRVRVESRRVNGTFKIITVAHLGDLWDGPWETIVEAVTL